MSSIDASALGRIGRRLQRFAKVTLSDVRPLLEDFERIIVEDNRKGVLSGLDRDDVPFIPVTYRGGLAIKTNARSGVRYGSNPGTFKGASPPGNNNLTSAEYRKLTGPPLAPRGQQSRIITNLKTGHGQLNDHSFEAVGGWDQFVDRKGRPILPYHFEGKGRNKIRNAAGVRKWGRNQALKAARAWGRWLLSRSK